MTERDVHAGNGRRAREAEARADADADLADAVANGEDPTSADYSVAFTPRNVAVGLAIVAGLVAFALSRRRRGGGSSDEAA
ncbi:MAG TPA: hypothetical protein VJ850_13090 [Candidatus Limnocylindrales bacterium]|nr:hypothetical protein [Candidatus Limnocylindrales bacterium]